jgi:diguanylate cyclase (GGDEF)-like protein/PAS domain S-box-containing protein
MDHFVALVTQVFKRKRAEEALRESEQRYRSLFETSLDVIFTLSTDGTLTSLSPAFETVTGWSRAEWLGESFVPIIHPDDLPLAMELFQRILQGETPPIYELRIVSKSGGYVVGQFTSTPQLQDGKVVGVLGIARDVTERKRAEREIEERRLYLEGVLGAAPDAIVTLDARHRIVEWNPGAEKLFGYSQEETIGQNLDHLITNPDVYEEAVGFTQRITSGREVPPTETVRYRKDGTPVDVIVAGSPIVIGDELIGVVAVYTDITARVRAEETIRQLAHHDALTGLPNRRLFNDRLNIAMAHAHRDQQELAVMLLDLDHFKDVNDTLGHKTGDKLLQAVGDRLTNLLRASDTVARMGGDEFMLICPEIVQGEDAAQVAQKTLDAFRKPFVFDDHELHITTSIGIAMYPDDGEDVETLMRNADIAMYRAKDLGRDNVQCYSSRGAREQGSKSAGERKSREIEEMG